ncbi:MAG: 3-phosphoshikimate 1-carboxyvinyltransferase [Planctomycetes bacterium]|nr:3-phosphoshikimate 1-carboxyvinyltransferase [Planctomycetota bacterium]
MSEPVKVIQPVTKPFDVRLSLPGSKSYSNRALICAALSLKRVALHGLSNSDDTALLLNVLVDLGWRIRRQRVNPANVDVHPHSHPEGIAGPKTLNAGNAGTVARFALALLARIEGEHTLDGGARMRQRPMADLIDALRQMGGGLTELGAIGCLPVKVRGGLLRGGKVTVKGGTSSQFLSAIMLIAPSLEAPTDIRVKGDLVSKPYIDATLSVMHAFGLPRENVQRDGYKRFVIKPARYVMPLYRVPPDATAASYFWAAAALTGGKCVIDGLTRDLPGDAAFVDLLGKMGCKVLSFPNGLGVQGPKSRALKAIKADLSDTPDTAQTLAVVCAFAKGKSKLTGLSTLRVKETDRIAALATELKKLGAGVRTGKDWIEIVGAPVSGTRFQVSGKKPSTTKQTRNPTPDTRYPIHTYDDHRMAMSFAVAGLVMPGIEIENPDCVSKSFPDFWEYFERLKS